MNDTFERKELDELYQLAITELFGTNQKLLIWAGGDAINQQDELMKAFTNRFPKVPIDIKVDLSKIHDLKIYEELLNGDLTPDVTMLQTSNDFEDWKRMGVLEAFKPQGFNQIRDDFKDPDGNFSAFRMFAFLPQYAKVGIKQSPTNLMDLLTNEYQDKLILTYPHDDDAVLYVYAKMLDLYGANFLVKLKELKPKFIRGTAVPPLLVGKDSYLGTLTGYETSPNQPSQSFVPDGDFFISWAQRIAMFKLTKHKAAARLFLAFVQSFEFQETLAHYSVRKDVNGQLPWIGSYPNTEPLGFYEFMRNREEVGKLRQQMKDYFGEVKGVSPVEDYQMIKITYEKI